MIQWFGFIDVTNSAPKAPQKVLKSTKKCQNYFANFSSSGGGHKTGIFKQCCCRYQNIIMSIDI
jgi:hypothetical protein